MRFTEAHVEHLLGTRVRDSNDTVVGRIEELRVDIVDGEYVVTEFHIGEAALVERIAAFVTELPFFRLIPFARKGYCVEWRDIDLSDPLRPRVRRPRSALSRITLASSEGTASGEAATKQQ
jgi:sporulation protein YlmC with PRC-barrel domain